MVATRQARRTAEKFYNYPQVLNVAVVGKWTFDVVDCQVCAFVCLQ